MFSDYVEPVLLAGLMGGFLCLLAQLLIDLTKLTPARIMVLFVTLGVVLYAFGIYDTLISTFSSGVAVPLLGFGATVARGVHDAVLEDGFLGIFSGGLSSSSIGISATLFLGFLLALLFSGRPKKM